MPRSHGAFLRPETSPDDRHRTRTEYANREKPSGEDRDSHEEAKMKEPVIRSPRAKRITANPNAEREAGRSLTATTVAASRMAIVPVATN